MTTKKPSKYKVVLDTVGLKYKADGNDVAEALGNLEMKWHMIKNKGTITVSKGKLKYEHLFYINQLKRLFANKTVRFVWGKRLTLLLNEQYGRDNI